MRRARVFGDHPPRDKEHHLASPEMSEREHAAAQSTRLSIRAVGAGDPVPCPIPGGSKQVHLSIASPLWRRVGIRTSTFEACSDFTHVTARSIAQPPKAAFVTGLQPAPEQAACQLLDQTGYYRGGTSLHW